MRDHIIYKINTANEKQVYAHLLACSLNFVPPLQERINVEAYAKKIASLAVNFEAWQNGILAGLIAAYFNEDKAKPAFITNVSVLKEMMGEGIASKLLQMTEQYAIAENVTAITLEVNANNQPAISFYNKYGYTLQAEKQDCLVMIKNIPGSQGA